MKRNPKRILAGAVGFVGFNALVASVQAVVTGVSFWISFALDCAVVIAFGFILIALAYAAGEL